MDGILNKLCLSDWDKAEDVKTLKKISKNVHRLIRATRKPSHGLVSLHALTEVILDFEAIKTGRYVLIYEE